MKKLILSLSLGLLALSLQAQPGSGVHPVWTYQSFFAPNVTTLIASNGPLAITNLNSLAVNGSGKPSAGTNTWGTTFTNQLGVLTMVTNYAAITNTAATFESLNLLQDVNLWSDRGGMAVAQWGGGLAGAVVSNSLCSVFIKLVGQSGANSAVNFYFVPLIDGTNETTVNEEFVVGVTANTTTPVSIYTNVPNKFIGVKSFRLRAINNVDTDATSNVKVLNAGLVGFSP